MLPRRRCKKAHMDDDFLDDVGELCAIKFTLLLDSRLVLYIDFCWKIDWSYTNYQWHMADTCSDAYRLSLCQSLYFSWAAAYTVPVSILVLLYPSIHDYVLCLVIWAMTWENVSSGFPTRLDTNRAVQSQRIVWGLKFWIRKIEEYCCTIYMSKQRCWSVAQL